MKSHPVNYRNKQISDLALLPEAKLDRQSTKMRLFEEIEALYRQSMLGPLNQVDQIGQADIVIGVPFYNETQTVVHVLKTAIKGLERFYPELKPVIVAAGSPWGKDALEAIRAMTYLPNFDCVSFIFDNEKLNGKGWSTRAIVDITDKLGADLVLLEADLKSRKRAGEIEGLAPEWIKLLLEPIESGEMDMVISRFNRHYFESPVATLTYPLFTSIYNCPISCLTGGQWGISHHLLKKYLDNARYAWHTDISGYGVDAWLATIAITSNARICEANLGIKIRRHSAAKADLILRDAARVMFDQIVNSREQWEKPSKLDELPLLKRLPKSGIVRSHQAEPVEVVPQIRIAKYKDGFNKFHLFYEKIFPAKTYEQLASLAETDSVSFSYLASLWAQTVYYLILAYAFNREFARDDILNSLIPLHHGFEASNVLHLQALKAKLEPSIPEYAERLLYLESESQARDIVNEFLRQKPAFLSIWAKMSEVYMPPVPQVTYREFIPGVPLVVPTELTSLEGKTISANDIYQAIFARQRDQFEHFVYDRIAIPRNANSMQVSLAIKDFMHGVETKIFPGNDLSTVIGITEMVNAIFDNFPHEDAFSMTSEMAAWILRQYPPLNLLAKWGYGNVDELLRNCDPRAAMALASWTEEREYGEVLSKLIAENVRPEHFAPCAIKPVIVSYEDFPSLAEMKYPSALDTLGSLILVSTLHKGMGGEFPRLRYLTTITRNIVEAERFGYVWKRFANVRKDFGKKVIDSLEGHWGREPLSAHAIFEDGHQRILAERVAQMADRIAQEAVGSNGRVALAEGLRALAESYHLALTFPDGKFVTCSAWSWASYNFKGGKKFPTPLSVRVEKDWASREFLVEYFKAIGGTESQVEEKVIELMGQGRESENLAPILLGTEKGAEEIIPKNIISMPSEQPLARELTRFSGNPVLEPVREHAWESKYVLNGGVIRLKEKVYMIYRALGKDNISRLGLAVSEDGFNFNERLDEPIFEPTGKNEAKGCEDPRLTLIGNRIYMAYTAYDGRIAQIALASIGIREFTNQHWNAWRRHGLVFPGFNDKDAALFPEQFKGKFAMLHRVDPHIWITLSSHLRCPWPRREHKILAGTTTGMMWDARKIGAGAQPLKTRYGWLLITHGVDFDHIYRLGVMLLDLDDPSKLTYRSPNFILEPVEKQEIGNDMSWVPNVVFTCGALPKEDHRKTLDIDDEIVVYYGAADTVVNVASAKLGELVPVHSLQLQKGGKRYV